ncbi:MAG: moderate conductance mechanosensitive channel [Frankiales bacterium]|nr:moderate conductance mechanosensitive channel [Frankiales bacterium]
MLYKQCMRPLRRTIPRIDMSRIELPRPEVTADFRAAVAMGLLAVGFLVAAAQGALAQPHVQVSTRDQALRIGGSIGFLLFGVYSVRRTGREVMRVLSVRIGLGHASVVRWVVTVAGYLVVGFTTLSLFEVKVGNLLLGGAVTGVVVGIAAQQSLGNVFAGVVLLLSRPFTVGDDIRLRSGALAGELNGRVTGMGLTYVALLTDDGPMSVPNAQVLAAAVGPQPFPREEQQEEDELPYGQL